MVKGSGISAEKKMLIQLEIVLKVKRCAMFDCAGTYVTAPGDEAQSILKCMLGILSGFWILEFDWVTVKMHSKLCEREEKYEASGSPLMRRPIREQMLPKPFDGPFFYLGETSNIIKSMTSLKLTVAGGSKILSRKIKPDRDMIQTINSVAHHANSVLKSTSL